MAITSCRRKTGYVFEEMYLWHDAGSISFQKWVEPGEIWENPETKRRFHSLISVSGLLNKLVSIRARHATRDEITSFHTSEYHDKVLALNDTGGVAGEQARFSLNGYSIAALSCGGVLSALEALLRGDINNAYCLIRPPGHHAVANEGMGFCIFNNIVIAALQARAMSNGAIKKVAIVDYDVHHGNGTQEAFWDDPDCLFISLHQDNNYPNGSGRLAEIGGPGAEGSTINIPLPPGSGTGAYAYAFDRVVLPALYKFKPDLILVSSGFDCSYADPLGAMMMSSEGFGNMATSLVSAAERLCGGRLIFAHEGGYSKDYVPFCGLAVMEALSGIKTEVEDFYLPEARRWGYQDLQPHQAAVIDAVATLSGISGSAPQYFSNASCGDLEGDHATLQALSSQEANVLEALRVVINVIQDPVKRKNVAAELLRLA